MENNMHVIMTASFADDPNLVLNQIKACQYILLCYYLTIFINRN